MDYFYTFLQSNFIEALFVVVYLRKFNKPEKLLFFVSFMNSLTHPWVFFGWMGLPQSYLANILCAEAFAIIVEGFLYRHFLKLKLSQAFFISVTANLISWQIGPILTWFFKHS